MSKQDKWMRWFLITTFIFLSLGIGFVMSYYPYPASLLLKVAYGVIAVSVILGIWAVYVLTK